jgi:hypothetical protein
MKKRILFLLLLLIFSGSMVSAQDLNFDEKIRRRIESGGIKTDDSRHIFGPEVTFRDTVIVNVLFLPPVFKPGIIVADNEIVLAKPFRIENIFQKTYYKPVKAFQKEKLRLQIENMAYLYLQRNQPTLFRYSIHNLPSEKITLITKTEKVKVTVETKTVTPDQYEAPKKFIPDRKYWISSLESALKFSENSTSDNWHSGPTKRTILNIFTKNIIRYNYAKDRIKWDNDLEVKLNFYNAPNDTLRAYKVSDDLLRLHSNFGVKALKKWYYTLDGEFKTQMFSNYQENKTQVQAAFLSPYTFNFGLGMKYDHTQKYVHPGRSVVLTLNLAPFAYTYMGTVNSNIDLGRHGFPKDNATDEYKRYLSKFGSTIDFNMTVKPTWDVTWKSRFKYFTSYDRVISEFENSLDFAISRYFSTLLYLHIRYDDGVTKVNASDSFFQWSQLMSFGFGYKW